MTKKNMLFGALQDTGTGISELLLTDIERDPDQPRRAFDEEKLQELASSIDQHGLVQPIVVRRHPDERGKYLIVAGERRFRAVSSLGHSNIDAIIRDDSNPAVIAIIENVQRVDLSAIEEADAVSRLMDLQSLSQAEVAKVIGKGRVTVTRLLKIHDLPVEIRTDPAAVEVTKSILIELAALEDKDLQLQLWKLAKEDNLTVAEIRKSRSDGAAPVPKPKGQKKKGKNTPARSLAMIDLAITRLEKVKLTPTDRGAVLDMIGRLNQVATGSD